MDTTHCINLDAASATPLSPEVLVAMQPFWAETFGNPSSMHALGRAARTALDAATDTLSALLGRSSRDCIFTGGATEALNLAIFGSVPADGHIVVSAIEHHAVLRVAEAHAARGGSVTVVAPDAFGVVHPDTVLAACTPQTRLVAVMAANNEIGTIQPIRSIGQGLQTRGIPLLCDAAQAVGVLDLRVLAAAAPLLVLSAAKASGPKGVGVLFAPADEALTPIIYGGGQQHRRRSGTENVPGIIGLVRAIAIAEEQRMTEAPRLTMLRERLLATLREAVPTLALHGHPTERLPGNLHVGVPGIDAEALVLQLDRQGVACSSGAACTAPMVEPSHVLQALGLPPELVRTGVRFTLPLGISEADVDEAGQRIIRAIRTLTREEARCLQRASRSAPGN